LAALATLPPHPSPDQDCLERYVPAWTADDANVTITPAADGLSAVISVAAGDTGTSFNLTVSGVSSNGNPISTSVSVPILPAPPPPPATGFDIEQTV